MHAKGIRLCLLAKENQVVRQHQSSIDTELRLIAARFLYTLLLRVRCLNFEMTYLYRASVAGLPETVRSSARRRFASAGSWFSRDSASAALSFWECVTAKLFDWCQILSTTAASSRFFRYDGERVGLSFCIQDCQVWEALFTLSMFARSCRLPMRFSASRR